MNKRKEFLLAQNGPRPWVDPDPTLPPMLGLTRHKKVVIGHCDAAVEHYMGRPTL